MPKVRFKRDGSVGIIVVDDPPLNLVGPVMIAELEQAIEAAHAAPIRALLLRSDAPNFSAGANVGEMFQNRSAAQATELLGRVAKMLARCESLPFPTLAAANGMCLAGGLEMALACDMIWAADDTKFGLVEGVIGAIPFGGGTARLAERAGPARAREIVMGMGMYDAVTFERWNIVNRVVASDQLADKALRFAHRLASGPTLAHAVSKRIVRQYLDRGVYEADRLTIAIAPALFETEDMRQGIVSLLECGPGNAKFSGR